MSEGSEVEKAYPRQKWVRVSGDVLEVMRGEADLSEWTDEELMRGRRRSKRGRFEGRPSTFVPREVYEEFIRRQLERAEQLLVTNVAKAVAELTRIATDPEVDDATKLRAIDRIMERVLGSVKTRVELSGIGEPPKHELIIEQVTIRRDVAEDDGEIVDAEVVGEEHADDVWEFDNEDC